MLRRFVSAMLAFPDWLYGRRAAGLDLGPALLAGGWALLMIFRPEVFDRGSFVGMSWMPDAAWVSVMLALVAIHVVGLCRPSWRTLRVTAGLLDAWIWISVAVSFLRIEISTGVLSYAIIGLAMLCGAVFLAGQPRERW